jgi:hypothetical protein
VSPPETRLERSSSRTAPVRHAQQRWGEEWRHAEERLHCSACTPLTRLTNLGSYTSMYIVFVLADTVQSAGERQVATSR